MPQPGALAAFRHRPFRLLIAGRCFVAFGNSMAPVSLAFAALDLTGSLRDVGLVVGARSVTGLLFVLVGGVIADRLPRHLVLVWAMAAVSATQLAMGGIVLTHHATVLWLAGLSALHGALSSVSLPAVSALTPQTMVEDQRQQGNALLRMAVNLAMTVGAPTAGIVTAVHGPGWAMVVTASLFVAAPICFARVGVPVPLPTGQRPSALADLRAGWHSFLSYQWLWVITGCYFFFWAALTGAERVLGPAEADRSFGRAGWGVVLALETVGMIIGALAALRLHTRRLMSIGAFALLPAVALPLALALDVSMGPLLIAAAITGAVTELFTVAWATSIQEHVPDALLARIFAISSLATLLALPVGQMLAGPIADAVGIAPTLLGCAAIMLVAAAGMCLSAKVRALPHGGGEDASTDRPALASA